VPSVAGTGMGAASTRASTGVATDGPAGAAAGEGEVAVVAGAAVVPTGTVFVAEVQAAVSNNAASDAVAARGRKCMRLALFRL